MPLFSPLEELRVTGGRKHRYGKVAAEMISKMDGNNRNISWFLPNEYEENVNENKSYGECSVAVEGLGKQSASFKDQLPRK